MQEEPSRSQFTYEEKLALAEVLGVLGMPFNVETVSDGELIDELDELCSAAGQTGYFMQSQALCDLYDKAQKIKVQMMRALKAGPLISLPVAEGEQLNRYLSRCSRERRKFPMSVRIEAAKRDLFLEDANDELGEFNLVAYEGRENLRMSEKLIDCSSYLQAFFDLSEHIDPEIAQDILSGAIVGKPLAPATQSAIHNIFSSVELKMIDDPRAIDTLEKLFSVITFYLQKLRSNGVIRKKPARPVFADIQVEMARKLGNIGQA